MDEALRILIIYSSLVLGGCAILGVLIGIFQTSLQLQDNIFAYVAKFICVSLYIIFLGKIIFAELKDLLTDLLLTRV